MGQTGEGRRRAAQYLRMSREHQNYSLECQGACNAAYARDHGWELVRTYTDAGISGLRLSGREGLKQLLADVLAGQADFDAVLVYDVSRWGRFQDIDQGAHYEFICREAGVQVIYTAEAFAPDGSFASTLLKHLKRAMAAEFSRELSAKVKRAKAGLGAKGYWVGGAAGYGLRRVAVGPDRQPRLRMETGEHKGLRGDRTILTPGPEAEVRTVQRIYRLFVIHGLRVAAIARLLNDEGVWPEPDVRWTGQRVRQVLTSERYAGVLVMGKAEVDLGRSRYRRRADWVRIEGAIEPVIPRALYDAAQAQVRRPKARGASDAQLLDELRTALRDSGRLSRAIINAHPATHCADVYRRRFGRLDRAFLLAGYQPSKRQTVAAARAREHRPHSFRPRPEPIDTDAALEALRAHYARLGWVSSNTIDDDPALPAADWYRVRFGGMGRVYALLGYEPTSRQRLHIERQRLGGRAYRPKS
jgi:DNA invertase Pin-like site-specific DNA recombinase